MAVQMSGIMLIARKFPPTIGGIQVLMHEVYSRMGNGVVVVAHNDTDSTSFDRQQPFPIYRTPTFLRFLRGEKGPLFPMLIVALRAMLKNQIGQLHCDQAKTGLVAYLLKRLLGKPYVVWAHGLEVRNNNWATLKRFVYRHASTVIANSAHTKRLLLDMGVEESKIRIITPGVDTSRFHPDVDPTPVVEKHRLQGKKVILSVGRLDAMARRKGQDKVIEALPQVLGHVPNAVYLIVGSGDDEAKLKELGRRLRVSANIIFAGRVEGDELPQYYCACNLFIISVSHTPLSTVGEEALVDYEGFGIVLLEAAACGKPVIGGRAGGVVQAVEDGVTGILVTPGEVAEISDALVGLLTDEEKARRMGHNGRERVVGQFRWERVAEETRKLAGETRGSAEWHGQKVSRR